MGDIAPSCCMPLAERSNMISQITSLMLDAVHAQLLAWQKSGLHWQVAIKLSANDLNNQALLDTIAEFAAGIDLSLVQFELAAAGIPMRHAGIGMCCRFSHRLSAWSCCARIWREPISTSLKKYMKVPIRATIASTKQAAIY
jgi:hypothetical protein